MNISLSKKDISGPVVPAEILGQNIEMALTTVNGFLSERLRNPKFTGPSHRMTGIAPEWQGASCGRAAYELTPGAGLMGSEAQLIRVIEAGWNPALHQNKLSIRAGEELELEVWARAWHAPVTLRIELRPLASRSAPYDSGEITVDASFYKRFTLPLKASRADDEARLVIMVVGRGELWLDQIHLRPKDEPLLCKGIVEAMATMRIPILRFPGGIVCNAYNWRHGTGPVHLRPLMLEAAFHQDWYLNYDFGLDEYLQIGLEQNISPALTLNVATGTPEEAAEWAAYCANWYRRQGADLPRIDWHIANHPYHYTTAHMTPAMYVNVLKTFVPAVKAGYPNSRIVAGMARQALTGDNEQTPWKEALLAHAADLVDVVQVQYYAGSSREDGADVQLTALASALDAFSDEMQAFIAESRSRGVQWNVGIAEWNWWMQASHWDGRAFEEPPTVLHGLFIAGMIHRFAAMAPDFNVAQFYNLVNCMGILNHRDADVEVTDAVEIFNLYRPALPACYVPLAIEGDTDEKTQCVDKLCLAGDGAEWLFITNRNDEKIARITLDGFNTEAAEGVVFQGAVPLGIFARETIAPTGSVIDVPPLSIVRIKMPR